ncbi:MAG TPA: MarR family transcriptional regulator [Halococcus sp.]|nr:MarR family transcriptional regulator [Halococcus sp.]
MGSREHVAFLAGSANRVRVLETLCEHPCRQCELIRECGLSRSTVHRTLDGLAARDWVRNDGGRYRLTAGGRFVLERYEALEASIERVDEWGPFLTRLDDIAATLPPAALDDAAMVANTPETPHAAISHLANALTESDAERFYGISPIVSPVLNEGARELAETGATMELLIDESVLDASRTAHPAALEDAYTLSNFTLYLYPDDLTFGLTILDDRVLVGAYDEQGVLRECLDGTNEALTAWANDIYEEYRERAARADSIAEPE